MTVPDIHAEPDARPADAGAGAGDASLLPPPLPGELSPAALHIETAVVIVLAVAPDVLRSVTSFLTSDATLPSYSSAQMSISVVTRACQVAAPVLYLMWRSGEPWRAYGFRRFGWRDLFGGLAAYVLATAAYYASYYGLRYTVSAETVQHVFASRIPRVLPMPRTAIDFTLATLMCLTNGFAEELVMRGYLIRRFEQIFASTTKAVLLSSGLFAAYHLYQGWHGALSAAIVGIVFGLIFVRYRRLWMLVVAHMTSDTLGMIMWTWMTRNGTA